MTNTHPKTAIREATAADRDFILSLVPRFADFGPPLWRTPQQIIERTIRSIEEGLARPADTFLIAEAGGQPLGFIRLITSMDYFDDKPVGYIADVAVVAAAEGQGVGRALMSAAEQWAESHHLGLLELHVFANNWRSIEFYEKLGYQPEVVKYVKLLPKG